MKKLVENNKIIGKFKEEIRGKTHHMLILNYVVPFFFKCKIETILLFCCVYHGPVYFSISIASHKVDNLNQAANETTLIAECRNIWIDDKRL